MYRRTLLWGVVIALCCVAGLSAQGKNLAGTWTLDKAMSGTTAESARGLASDFTIKVDDKNFVVTTVRGQSETVMTYKLDGSESYNTPAGRNPVERAYKFAWEGEKATITSKTSEGEEKTQYWLQGEKLAREVTRPGGQPVRTYFTRTK